eukprot:gene15148-21210_t
MAVEGAPPSKLATFFRTLLCASGSVKCSENECSVKAAKPKGAWTQQSDHDDMWSNVVQSQMFASGNDGDTFPPSSSQASGKIQRHSECLVSSPLPSVHSNLIGTTDIQVCLLFDGCGILGDEPISFPGARADQQARTHSTVCRGQAPHSTLQARTHSTGGRRQALHSTQEARMHSTGGWQGTPLRDRCQHPQSDGGGRRCTPPGEQSLHPRYDGGGRRYTLSGEQSQHPLPADGTGRQGRRISMGNAMVESSQASSNRFPSSRDRRQVQMESSSSSPLVYPKPAWLRTAGLTPRLQNSRVGRLLELQMQSSPTSSRATRPYGASQSFRLPSSSRLFPPSRRSMSPPPLEGKPPSAPLSFSFKVTETRSQDFPRKMLPSLLKLLKTGDRGETLNRLEGPQEWGKTTHPSENSELQPTTSNQQVVSFNQQAATSELQPTTSN